MARTRTVFIAAMSLAGLLLGLFAGLRPDLGPGVGLAALVLLGVVALTDFAAMRGLFGLVRLSHGLRFGGLVSGFAIYLAVVVSTTLLRVGSTVG